MAVLLLSITDPLNFQLNDKSYKKLVSLYKGELKNRDEDIFKIIM